MMEYTRPAMGRLIICVALLAILVGLMLPLTSCTPRPTKGEVVVYVAVPLSGWQAEGGQTLAGGVRLRAWELNQAGGLLGYTVTVVAIDDEADPDVAAEVAGQIEADLAAGKKVVGVIGHYNSGETSVAMQVYKDLPFVVVTATASDVAITQRGYRNFFRVNATDAAQAPVAARFLVEELGAGRIILVHADNDYGRGLRDQMTRALDALGRPAVLTLEIQEAAPSYASAVRQIVDAAPDAVFLAGYETEGYVLLPELREAGLQAPFMCSDGCLPYAFIDESGPAAEGAYVSGITPDATAVSDVKWWQSYQAVENRNPGTYSTAGYSAMDVLTEAIRQAGSFESGKIVEAMHRLRYRTLVGEISYDLHGDLEKQNIYIFQVRQDKYEQIYPEP